MAPELFRAEGGISRILRLYLRALAELAGPQEELGYVALNDLPVTPGRVRECAGREVGAAVGCDHGKLGFISACFRHGWSAGRVLCGHLHQLSIVWLLSLLRPGLKYYLVAHGIEVWRPFAFLERRALRGAHRILCISEYTRRQLLRFDPKLEPGRLVIVPNTFDPGFSTPADWSVTRPGFNPRILAVSRLTVADRYKGIDTMIEAMPAIRERLPAAQLRIVGGGNDEGHLRELARELGLAGAVHFTGIISDAALRTEYAACDIFALPSRKEGFGLVYLEAMTYGKPCLAARAGGAPEVVNDEVGAVVEYGNIGQIALAVADMVRHPRDPAAMLRRAGEFSFPRFKDRLAEVLRDEGARASAP